MNTGTTPLPTFEYGRVDFDPTTGFTNYSTIGAADGGSTFSSDGTITIVLSNSKLNQYPDMTTGAPPPTAGSVFSAVHGEIQALAGGGGSGFLALHAVGERLLCAQHTAHGGVAGEPHLRRGPAHRGLQRIGLVGPRCRR